MASIEEKVEEQYKNLLDSLGIRHYGKTEEINSFITNALNKANSKSGGSGNNYPDIKLLLDNNKGRYVPVMIEAKGLKGKLEKLSKDGSIVGITYYDSDGRPNKDGVPTHLKGDANYNAIKDYAVNGAVHYGNAILDEGEYKEVIVIGINGTMLNKDGSVSDTECKAYYLSTKNNRVPKIIDKITATDWSLLKTENLDRLFGILDKLNLTDKEIEELTKKTEKRLEEKIKAIHQDLYDNPQLRTALSTNEKLYLFCGLIIAGLTVDGVKPLELSDFHGDKGDKKNDGVVLLNSIDEFLNKKCPGKIAKTIKELLDNIFKKPILWEPKNGVSLIKKLFAKVKADIIPCFEGNLHLDFMSKIFNSLSDWVSIENDSANDVVLTPRYITTFMARLARVNKDSYVWDMTMGTGGYIASSIDIMIKDATNTIADKKELAEKIERIKKHQVLGIEILKNVYVLAILNMILMDSVSDNIINADSHGFKLSELSEDFPADAFLLNPPYSSAGKGFDFIEEALNQMKEGYACIIIQDSAGNGQGLPYTKRILEHNTLEASIKMPNIFNGKASVATYIFVFKVAQPHDEKNVVKFIDFTNDGYTRQNRKKSTQEVNLRNTDHAEERYEEVLNLVLYGRHYLHYYKEGETYIEDTITLNGDDWTMQSHVKVNTTPTEEDFRKTVSTFLSWKVKCLMENNL